MSAQAVPRPTPQIVPPIAIDLVALAAGVTWLLTGLLGRPIGDYGVETDFYGEFARYAQEWMRGQPSAMSGYRGPAYILLLGSLGRLLGDFFLAGKLISAISAAVGIRLLGGLLRRLWGPVAGLAGILFVAANAAFVSYTFRACTDMLFWALVVGTFVLILHPDRQRPLAWACAGLVAGVAYLTRYNGFFLLPAALLVALFTVRPLQRAGASMLALLVGWMIVCLPWMLFLWHQVGDPLWNRNFQNVAIAVYVTHPTIAHDGHFFEAVGFESPWEVIAVAPARFARVMLGNVITNLRHDVDQLVGLAWAVLAAIGLVATGRGWLERGRLAFAAGGVLAFASTIPVFYGVRFMLPLLIWWSAGIGALVVAAGRWATRSKLPGRNGALRSARTQRALIGLLVVAAVIANYREIRSSHDPMSDTAGATELLELVRQVKSSGEPIGAHTPISARKPHIGFYLDAPIVPPVSGSLEELRNSGAHYVLVSGPELRMQPELSSLLYADAERIPPELRLVARSVQRTGRRHARSAALFAVAHPLPYVARDDASPGIPSSPTHPQLARLDALRYRLALFYLTVDRRQSVPTIVREMSPPARDLAEVRGMLADDALLRRDSQEAVRLYRELLRDDPTAPRWQLHLAAARAIRGNWDGIEARVPGPESAKVDSSALHWRHRGVEALMHKDYAAALAALMVCEAHQALDVESDLAHLFRSLGWRVPSVTESPRQPRLPSDR